MKNPGHFWVEINIAGKCTLSTEGFSDHHTKYLRQDAQARKLRT